MDIPGREECPVRLPQATAPYDLQYLPTARFGRPTRRGTNCSSTPRSIWRLPAAWSHQRDGLPQKGGVLNEDGPAVPRDGGPHRQLPGRELSGLRRFPGLKGIFPRCWEWVYWFCGGGPGDLGRASAVPQSRFQTETPSPDTGNPGRISPTAGCAVAESNDRRLKGGATSG